VLQNIGDTIDDLFAKQGEHLEAGFGASWLEANLPATASKAGSGMKRR